MLAADLVLGHGVEGLQHQLAIGVSAGGGRGSVCALGVSNMSGGASGCVWFIHRNGVWRPLGGGRCCLRTRTRVSLSSWTAGVVGDLDAGAG